MGAVHPEFLKWERRWVILSQGLRQPIKQEWRGKAGAGGGQTGLSTVPAPELVCSPRDCCGHPVSPSLGPGVRVGETSAPARKPRKFNSMSFVLLQLHLSHIIRKKGGPYYFARKLFKHWSIVDLQSRVNFTCIAQWLSYTYTCIYSLLDFFPVCCCCCFVAKLCLTLCDPMDCSPPGSSVHGIHQVTLLEWVAIPLSRGSSWPRDQTQVFCITVWAIYTPSFLLSHKKFCTVSKNVEKQACQCILQHFKNCFLINLIISVLLRTYVLSSFYWKQWIMSGNSLWPHFSVLNGSGSSCEGLLNESCPAHAFSALRLSLKIEASCFTSDKAWVSIHLMTFMDP